MERNALKIVDISVELIDHMGDDLTVVNAARVSFNKQSEWEWDKVGKDEFGKYITNRLSDKDVKLIHYLAKHNHWTPFGHCQATFRIQAPIFVARQLMRHNVGLVVNEVSRRYVDSEPEFYFPPQKMRGRAVDKKQGSAGEIELPEDYNLLIYELLSDARSLYLNLIDKGVAPEQARMILPQNMMTEWFWTGSLAAFGRVCKLRMSDDTQAETCIVATIISEHMSTLYPVSWANLIGNITV